ncbi:MAG: YggS family pyridoxal phosphate-dependent enzyme [Chloroflexi bacterium]|nr:YggS family pyridoxal phosphate-dependent enzyme [Chloroflexota bacterium]
MENELQIRIQKNLDEINEIVTRAAMRSGRNADEITVLAVSKRQPVEVIEAAYRCGQMVFGESYVQEALPKIEHFQGKADVRWDMVGHIQSRKARQVAESFHTVHSLDSINLAQLLSRHRPGNLPPLDVFLEVNIGDEGSKSGFLTATQEDWEELIIVVKQLIELPKINLVGLMGMPPLFADPQESRPYFQKLKKLSTFLADAVAGARLTQLSAGTSADFEVAIEEGSTIVRIGERLLGPRDYSI